MTHEGSDKLLPERGTEVASSLFSYGVFDLLGMQHLLNFGALKARSDMQAYETGPRGDEDRVAAIRLTLMEVRNNVAHVAVRVTNQAAQISREVFEIE